MHVLRLLLSQGDERSNQGHACIEFWRLSCSQELDAAAERMPDRELRHALPSKLLIDLSGELKNVISRSFRRMDEATSTLAETEASLVHGQYIIAVLSQLLRKECIPA